MQWFRFYHEALDDPKVQQLDGNLFKAWVNLLCLCCRNGGLPRSVSDIAFALRIDVDGCLTVLQRLSSGGLIDKVSGGADGMHYAIHGWEKRQFKSDTSTDRVKRFRERYRNDSETVNETGPDTDTDTYTEINKKEKNIQKRKRVSRSHSVADFLDQNDFDIFWKDYPRKVSKGTAVKAWQKAMAKTTASQIIEALHAWKRSKDFPTEEKFIPHATTWLNAERWLDIPAEPTGSDRVYTDEEKRKFKEETQKWLAAYKSDKTLPPPILGR